MNATNRKLRFVFHAGVHTTEFKLLQENLAANLLHLRMQGVYYVNLEDREALSAQMWVIRRLEKGDVNVGLNKLLKVNQRLQERARAQNAHTILLSHADRLGYAPHAALARGERRTAFYPRADICLSRIMAGFDPKDTRILLYSKPHSALLKALYSGAVRNLSFAGDIEAFYNSFEPETLSYRSLLNRIGNVVPQENISLRANADLSDDPESFIRTFFRDIGMDPTPLTHLTSPPSIDVDRDQAGKFTALAQARQDSEMPRHEINRRFDEIKRILPDPDRPIELPERVANACEGMAASDILTKQIDPLPILSRQEGQKPKQRHAPLKVFFMVEPGPLELQARLLINSLKVYCEDDFVIETFCRHDRIQNLHSETKGFLAGSGIPCTPITNPFPDGYPAGNKLIASGAVSGADWFMFMDTDMVMLRRGSFLAETRSNHVSLVVDTLNAWTQDEQQWRNLYGAYGLTPPSRKISMQRGEKSYPLYNAGMVLFPGNPHSDDHFGQCWRDTAYRIEMDQNVEKKRPWLDSISLPLSVDRRADLNVNSIDRRWNDTADLANADTVVLHYHGLRQIVQHGWKEQIDTMLRASSDWFNSFDEIFQHYKDDIRIEGNLFLRAMRHGLNS